MSGYEREWVTKAGFRARCLLVQNGSHRCGYVEVPKGHPLFGIKYSTHTDAIKPLPDNEPMGGRGVFSLLVGQDSTQRADVAFDVHGSITFSGDWSPAGYEWWFGFDCAHEGDERRSEHAFNEPGAVWWTQEMVEAECERLAEQLISRVNWPREVMP